MSKKSIDWHRDCHANASRYYYNRRLKALQDIADCDKGLQELVFYDKQINKAIQLGMDGFDCDKFMVKRKTSKGQDE